jgi:hypothetical protein
MRHAVVLALSVAGCTGSSVEEARCHVEATQEPVRACFPEPLEPVTDPDSPDYGRVPCVALVARRSDTVFCECAVDGYAPPTDSQVEIGRDELRSSALCEGACCEEYCLCQLRQFSGDDLAYCQGRLEAEPPGYARGFCYVEPDRGFGDPSTVENCPESQRRLVLFHPPGGYSGSVTFIACEN